MAPPGFSVLVQHSIMQNLVMYDNDRDGDAGGSGGGSGHGAGGGAADDDDDAGGDETDGGDDEKEDNFYSTAFCYNHENHNYSCHLHKQCFPLLTGSQESARS